MRAFVAGGTGVIGRRLVPHEVLEGRIQTIRSVINPDKLRHLGPAADAWALAREANQARRP